MPTHEIHGLWLAEYALGYQSDISVLAEALGERLLALPYALIMWWDSGGPARLAGSSVGDACARAGVEAVQAPGGVALATRDLVRLAMAGDCLYGFDEVWFGAEPFDDASFLPVRLSPAREIRNAMAGGDTSEVDQTRRWMEAHGAVLGLKDGIGLDVVTTSARLAAELDALLTGMQAASLCVVRRTGQAAGPLLGRLAARA